MAALLRGWRAGMVWRGVRRVKSNMITSPPTMATGLVVGMSSEVDGAVDSIEAASDEHLVELTRRYLPADKVEGYLEMARAEHGESVIVRMRPQHWNASDLGSL